MVLGGSKNNKGDTTAMVVDYYDIPAFSGQDFENVVAKRVVALALDATTLKSYQGGIISGKSCYFKELTHGVSAVGYSVDKETG